MRITFLLPALNEEAGIGRTLDAIPRKALEGAGHEVEVLVVDGGSTDRTVELARARRARVVVERRRGYGLAYKVGLREASGDLVITGDADGTYPLEDAPAYLEAFRERGLDFATVNRYARIDDRAMRGLHRLGNLVLTTTTRLFFRVPVRDSQSGMWILARRAIARLPLDAMSDGMPFSAELKIRAFRDPELRCAELPGRYRARLGEPKLMSWRDGFRNWGHLFRLRFCRGALRHGNP